MLVLLLGRERTDPVLLGATLGSLSGVEGPADLVPLFTLELLQTFALMLVILLCIVSGRARPFAGPVVGCTVIVCILAFGPLTGSSMNPARTFGPMLYHFDAHAASWWVYFVAPVLGAAGAGAVYRFVLEERGIAAE